MTLNLNLNLSSDKALARLSAVLIAKDYAKKTQLAYVDWTRRFLKHYEGLQVIDLGPLEVTQYLNHLETDLNLTLKSRSAARNALIFFFKQFGRDLSHEVTVSKFQRAPSQPDYLSVTDTQRLLDSLNMPYSLIAGLMVKTGIRLTECMSIKLIDIQFTVSQAKIDIFTSRGQFDRQIVVPEPLFYPLRQQYFEALSTGTKGDLSFLFPSAFKPDQHLHQTSFQRAIQAAGKELGFKATSQILRHTFAVNALLVKQDPHEVKDLMGIKTLGAMSAYRALQ